MRWPLRSSGCGSKGADMPQNFTLRTAGPQADDPIRIVALSERSESNGHRSAPATSLPRSPLGGHDFSRAENVENQKGL